MTLSQIYDWMVAHIPYFGDRQSSSKSAGWKVKIIKICNKIKRHWQPRIRTCISTESGNTFEFNCKDSTICQVTRAECGYTVVTVERPSAS